MRPITALYTITLLYALHYSLPLYSESTFLGGVIDPKYIGVTYGVAALLAFFTTIHISGILNRTSLIRATIAIIILECASLLILAFATTPFIILTTFILHSAFLGALFIVLNILVEAVSSDHETGRVRGAYLTVLNVGIITGPFFASYLVQDGFMFLFLASATCLALCTYFLVRFLSHVSEITHKIPDFVHAMHELRRSPDTSRIMYAQFLLELFFAIMVIYVPLFVIKEDIASLSTYLGIILPIALIPFILLPYPLGRLADTKLGEKELLFGGFTLMITGLLLLAFVPHPTVTLVACILLLARIGASMVEEMASSYFYKHVSVSDVDVISLFTNTRNIALIIAPVIGSILLSFAPERFSLIFITFACMLTVGIIPLFKLHDTK